MVILSRWAEFTSSNSHSDAAQLNVDSSSTHYHNALDKPLSIEWMMGTQ